MPRSPRYSSPGAIHHVMLRGNQGRQIFYSDADRIRCCLLIQEGIERYGYRIHGFCLMSNHIHLAWQVGEENLSAAVQNLAFRYAQGVNHFRKEVGHVFQGRFKSILVEKEGYLTRLVRYIHLNPVRAGIVKRPEDYKWCGHNSYLGTDPIIWVERSYVLRRYSEDCETAIRRYNEFIHAGIRIDIEPEVDFKTGMQSGIIGDDTFVEKILNRDCDKIDNLELTVTELIEKLCSRYGISKTEIISQNRNRDLAHARAVLALLVRNCKGLSIVELAKVLERGPSGLSRLANKLDIKCRTSSKLKQEIKSLRNELFKENILILPDSVATTPPISQ